MNTKTRTLLALGCALALCAPAMAAQRTFVSGTGVDTNDCALPRPCRGFATAMAHTDANGEIVVLDSAGYGTVVIDKSVSIVAPPGVYAGISVFSGAGIMVNPGIGGKVVLRGLTINGQGGDVGIWITGGDEIHVEKCVVSNMSNVGLYITGGIAVRISNTLARSNASDGMQLFGSGTQLFVADSSFSESGYHGILQLAGSLSVDRVRLQKNGASGLAVAPATTTETVKAFVRDSDLSGNHSTGALVQTNASGESAAVTLERSVLARNAGGIFASSLAGTVTVALTGVLATDNLDVGIRAEGSGTTVGVMGSTATRNFRALSQASGAFLNTYGNNALGGNAMPPYGTITPIPLQ